ncbi:hypothetical protein [Hymenobacter daeguensis]
MTRATLLHVLDRPTALGPAEVRELEQLAQAFPYCQTAHLLLAKAAHDQGTMLAGQRLRRAATYAADRTLLRRLIELVEPAAIEPAPQAAALAAPAEMAEPARPQPAALATPAALPTPAPVASAPEVPAPVPTPIPEAAPAAAPAVVAEAAEEAAAPELPVAVAAEPVPAVLAPAVVAPEILFISDTPALELPVEAPLPAIAQASEAPTEAPVAEAPLPVAPPLISTPEPLTAPSAPQPAAITPVDLVDQKGVSIQSAAQAAETAPEDSLAPEPMPDEADLPAQAPAIRPPVEVGEARFEFGLAEPPPAVVPTYELPGLVDEFAASAVTLSLGSIGALLPATEEALEPAFTPAAFTGDAAVGYSFGESSRLGLSMQLLDLLAAQAEAAEAATAVVAAAQPPAMALPPTGTYFEPDPLLLDHWATHCPPPPAQPSSLDLINNFLKRQPRLTRPAMLPPTTGGQTDLSARSTNAAPDLVSENLARIFVRQGKIARAIEIYEKLMVKQPEKMAYFAAQIQSLQPSA